MPAPRTTNGPASGQTAQTLKKPPRILIADDHGIVRCGLRQIISAAFPAAEIVECADGSSAIQQALAKKFSAIVLDISMPDYSGLEVLSRLKASGCAAPVLILSMHGEDAYGSWAFTQGAAGYLTKSRAHELLPEALGKVLSGGRYVTPTMAERLASSFGQHRAGAPHEGLSEREFQVLCRIGRGSCLKEIAADLQISPKTVSTYHVRLREKMGLRTDGELIRYVMDRGLRE